MKDSQQHERGDYFGEEYFERGAGSSYSRNIPPYSKAEEDIRRYYISYLNMVNKYFDVLNGKGKKALEIGCAYGYGLKLLETIGYDVYGIDFSEYAIKQAKDFLGDSGYIAVADGRQLPFRDSQFDLVIAIDVLEHVYHAKQVVANCYRVLKSGGLFGAVIPNKLSLMYQINMLVSRTESQISPRPSWDFRKAYKNQNWQTLNMLYPQWLPKIQRKLNIRYLGVKILILARK